MPFWEWIYQIVDLGVVQFGIYAKVVSPSAVWWFLAERIAAVALALVAVSLFAAAIHNWWREL